MKPDFNTIPEYYHGYVNLITEENVIEALKNSKKNFLKRLKSIPDQNGDFRYDKGKWSIKELINHVIDTERVFAYRALSFARNDDTELPGFEVNDWTSASQADRRNLNELIEEYENVSNSTINFFKSLTVDMLLNTGKANGSTVSVLNLGYIIAGHETHHGNILNERYMSS
ncbi:MAG: DinB family protein [Cyclobacteriaceae bacterium]|nr:DinB family protein [Cyclobacteriaceae bacterium]